LASAAIKKEKLLFARQEAGMTEWQRVDDE
jgi:hypothetical protein